MAKKKQNLSKEELLEQAILPESECPYKVPDNWVWTNLGNVAIYKKGPFGSSITKAMFVPKGRKTYKVYEQGNAIRKDKNYGSYYITKEKYEELKSFKVEPGDLIVSCAGTVGETYQLPDEIEQGVINQALMKVKVNSKISLKYYLLYFDQILRKDIAANSKGTAIKNIPPFSVLKNMPFPLPPLSEQQRIVERIESLSEKLDKSKELIQDAIDSFENRKTAILHKAFSGELTQKWREENGVRIESWEEKELGMLLNPMKSKKPEGDFFSYIDIDAIDNKNQIVSSPKIIKSSEAPSRASREISSGDVLFSMVRPYLRNIAYITDEISNCIASTGFYVCKCTKLLNSKFLYFYLCSESTINYLMCFMKGDNSPSIRKGDIEKLKLNLPTINEQIEIVKILDDIFEKEQSAYELYDLIEKIDLMKKAILARAFRGELGTNDSLEESAISLLAEIIDDLK